MRYVLWPSDLWSMLYVPYLVNIFLITAELPKKPVNSSPASLTAVSKNDSVLSVPPPKSEKPGAVSSYFPSLPNKKYSLPLCIVVGNIISSVVVSYIGCVVDNSISYTFAFVIF